MFEKDKKDLKMSENTNCLKCFSFFPKRRLLTFSLYYGTLDEVSALPR